MGEKESSRKCLRICLLVGCCHPPECYLLMYGNIHTFWDNEMSGSYSSLPSYFTPESQVSRLSGIHNKSETSEASLYLLRGYATEDSLVRDADLFWDTQIDRHQRYAEIKCKPVLISRSLLDCYMNGVVRRVVGEILSFRQWAWTFSQEPSCAGLHIKFQETWLIFLWIMTSDLGNSFIFQIIGKLSLPFNFRSYSGKHCLFLASLWCGTQNPYWVF